MPLNPDEFRCGVCGGVFTKGWSDEEAAQEAAQNPFGLHQPPPNDPFNGATDSVCDDCYRALMVWAASHGGVKNAMRAQGLEFQHRDGK